MIVSQVRPAGADRLLDVRVADGVVAEVGPHLRPDPGEPVLAAAGRWVVPGLWDHHVHLGQLGVMRSWFDTSAARTPEELLALVRAEVAAAADPSCPLVGFGARPSLWRRSPHRAELDAVSGDHLVVLVSGDAHSGWLNTAAQRRFDVAHESLVAEDPWFAVLARLDELVPAEVAERDVAAVVADAQALGVVGITDLSFAPTFEVWPDRCGRGLTTLRVRAGFYPPHLDAALTTGLRTGDPVAGLVTMGPLKVISDGSLGSLTAACDDPYGPAGTRGVRNVDRGTLTDLARRCAAAGLEVTFHAIGDRACGDALDAIEAAGATGSLEHVQLVRSADLPRFARLGVVASVQPHHVVDDVAALDRLWADRADRAFAFADLLAAGARLRFGSDAPISPLDPWLAMASAVHRNTPDAEAWHPEQHLTAAQALACSVDDHPGLVAGARADLVILDADPLAPQSDTAATARHLLAMRDRVWATVVAGEVVRGG